MTWRKNGQSYVRNQELLDNSCKILERMYLPTRTWLTVKRIEPGKGGVDIFYPNLSTDDNLWDCGETKQTVDHIVQYSK